jgi:hypothetical protein
MPIILFENKCALCRNVLIIAFGGNVQDSKPFFFKLSVSEIDQILTTSNLTNTRKFD